jgi:pyruvate dehydrogenase E2 component (dihydrolipoamide acetyltransferase)
MAIPITVPRLGWNMEQGVFVDWLKGDGAMIHSGDTLFTLEGEKATEDIQSFDDGILHIPIDGPNNGDVVAVGAVIGFLLQAGEPPPVTRKQTFVAQPLEPIAVKNVAAKDPTRERIASSPRARRAAAKIGIDWKNAAGTGRAGRIRERDVLAMSANVRSTRNVIAERMLASHRSTAPVTLMATVDATSLVELRERLKATAKNGDVIPSYTDLFVQCAARALGIHPVLNARWENDRIIAPDGIHIGIAVDTDAGLLVPVLRNVSHLSLKELSARARDLIGRARQCKLAVSEMQGGTFTVTSLGAFGIDAFTPIINYPECAILGIGRIRRCPAVFEDQIVIRDQVTLALTFDHRITDGAPAARFLQTLTALVENPAGVK